MKAIKEISGWVIVGLFLLFLINFCSCKKEKSPEPIKTLDPITSFESQFVGKWIWYKTENRNSSGILLSVNDTATTSSYPYEGAFIELTSTNYGDENHKYIERYGNLPSVGASTSWEANPILNCTTFPEYITINSVSVTTTQLIINENSDNSGKTIYYYK